MRVFLDMDGVLSDFADAAYHVHGRGGVPKSYDFYKDEWGMSAEEFWAPMNNTEFWMGIDKTFYADDIVRLAERIVMPENVFIATSPTLSAYSAAGKMAWINEHYPVYLRRLVITPAKHLFANSESILIDDNTANVNSFEDAGGYAFLVPQSWNEKHDIAHLNPVKDIAEAVAYFVGHGEASQGSRAAWA